MVTPIAVLETSVLTCIEPTLPGFGGKKPHLQITWPLFSSFHCDSEMVVSHGSLFGRRGLPSAARLLRLVL